LKLEKDTSSFVLARYHDHYDQWVFYNGLMFKIL